MNEIDDLDSFIENLNELPTLSPVALRIVEIADDDDSSLSEMTKLIESDQSLSSKVLRTANYTLLRSERHGEIKTVKHATAILGMNLIRSIALSFIVLNLFESSTEDEFNITEYWRHNAACAILGELLAKKLGYPHPEEAFIAGLLHDLGKLVLHEWNKGVYVKAVKSSFDNKRRLLECEESLLDVGHTQVAKLLMERWKFPESLIDAAWMHHQPLSEFGSDYLRRLPFIIKCADSMCHIHRFGDSGNYKSDLNREQLIISTGLSSGDLDDLASKALNCFEDVAKGFDWNVTAPDLYLSAISRANHELFQQQLESVEVKQRLTINQHLIKLMYNMLESLSQPISLPNAIKTVTESLVTTIPYKRAIGLVRIADRNIFSGYIKLMDGNEGHQVALPINRDLSEAIKNIKLREQISVVREIVENQKDEIPKGGEIINALDSPNLKIQPMYIGGQTIGLFMVEFSDELSSFNWSQQEKTIFLRRYALTAATALDRLMKDELLKKMNEEKARLARAMDELQTRLEEKA